MFQRETGPLFRGPARVRVSRMFWTRLEIFGDRVALDDPSGRSVTYAELSKLADDWSARIAGVQSSGQPVRTLVAVEMSSNPDAVAAYLGALRGAHPVIVCEPGSLTADSVILRTYRPSAVLRAAAAGIELQHAYAPPTDLHPDLCLMLSTSGSTGDPRLVRLSQRNVASNAASIAEYLKLDDTDCAVTTLPLHYSYGLSVLHSHLAVGARMVLGDLSVTDAGFLRAASETGVTGLALVPHQVDLIEAQHVNLAAIPSLRRVTQAGGRLAPEAVRRMAAQGRKAGWDFVVMYGQTEAGPRMAWLPPDRAEAAADTIGQAIPGGTFWIEDADGARVTGPGRSGHLVYRGPNVMMGYADGPGDLAAGAGPDILQTGDIAEYANGGLIRLIGRAKRFVKLFGLRLSLDRIEAQLATMGVTAHATGVDDRLAVLVPPGTDHGSVRDALAQSFDLPGSAVHVLTLTGVPRLASGKPDLQRLAAMARDGLAQEAAASRGDISEAYRQALRLRRVAPGDSFASLGGDSLAYLHAQMAIEDHLGHAPKGWEQMTLAELEAMRPVPAKRTHNVDGSTLLRIAAMTCVIVFHLTLWPIAGGTFALLILVGYSLARFQRSAMAEGAALQIARALLIPILPIYFVLIATFDALRGQIPPEMYFLVANFLPRFQGNVMGPYWFISLYAQIVLCAVIVSLVPALRRAIRATPFEFGLTATMLCVAVSVVTQGSVLHLPVLTGGSEAGLNLIAIRILPVIIPLVSLGWTIHFAETKAQRRLVMSALLLILAVLSTWTPNHIAIPVVATLVLLARVEMPMPAWAARIVHQAASATLFVYLVHNMVVHAVRHATPVYATLGPVASALVVVPATFALGLAVKLAYDRLERFIIRPAEAARAPT